MTTIAYRDGFMAADTQAYLGHGEPGHGRKPKVHRLKDGALCGISSSIIGAGPALVAWIEAGADWSDAPLLEHGEWKNKFEIMLVRRSGELLYWNDGFLPSTFDARFMAIGSGGLYALGAMAAGCSAKGAVAIACEFDNFSGGNVEQWALHDAA